VICGALAGHDQRSAVALPPFLIGHEELMVQSLVLWSQSHDFVSRVWLTLVITSGLVTPILPARPSNDDAAQQIHGEGRAGNAAC
jgi:hypothetical protein